MSLLSQPPAGGARIDQEFFSAALADTLARGDAVWLRVRGVSMLPWLREGQKVRVLPAAGRRLVCGDIALFWRGPGQPILHRVVRVHRAENFLECLGDSEVGAPEKVATSAVIGVVATTPVRRAIYRMVNPARRGFNRFCLKQGLRLRHG